MPPRLDQTWIAAQHYDLPLTFQCGQAFRWHCLGSAWQGVVGSHWVRLTPAPGGFLAETPAPANDWRWLTRYLQSDVALDPIVRTFPADPAMQASVAHCRGLRLLRQEPWECLASFILSSCKRIPQIQQIIALLCQNFGSPVPTPDHVPLTHAFPTPHQIAARSERELRDCKMGWRAKSLLETSRLVAHGEIDLETLRSASESQARQSLMQCPGVGPKIANCVLLFAYGFPKAIPVDVWIARALRSLYFPKRKLSLPRLQELAARRFGPQAGYAQQYLFHYMRTRPKSQPQPRMAGCPAL